MRHLFVGSALALAFAVTTAGSPQAGATAAPPAGPTWVVQHTPDIAGRLPVALTSVSCVATTACTAVGWFGDGAVGGTGANVPLAAGWNGTTWDVQTTPSPPGAAGSYLTGVSCASVSTCIAVGGFSDRAQANFALAELWNGRRWTIESVPDASVTTLNSVSCASPSWCVAVGEGDGDGSGTTVAVVWNGARWKLLSTPGPAPGSYPSFSSVSCPTTTSCTAVGAYFKNAGTQATLAEAWNGAGWRVEATPKPPGSYSPGATLSGVSCSAGSACTAVGSYSAANPAGTQILLAEAWNGATWTIEPAPDPSGGVHGASSLAGVACTSPAACTAVGSYFTRSGRKGLTLAERWNGTRWSIEPTPDRADHSAFGLSAVSCVSAPTCIAVGAAGFAAALVYDWNGTRWQAQVPPDVSGPTDVLSAVSCSAAEACAAVGYRANLAGTAGVALIETWNGANWRTRPAAVPPGAVDAYLVGVSCRSATACTAVGFYGTKDGDQATLAEVWNGTAWTVESTPNPSGSTSDALLGVSCPSAGACTAVGYTDQTVLAETFNGTTWSIRSTPTPSGTLQAQLAGVSCAAPAACTAVGDAAGPSGQLALAERWDGASWTLQSPPSPSATTTLSGVSCPSGTACSAVGFYDGTTGAESTLDETWNGRVWTVTPTPALPGSSAGELSSISCRSAAACTAVGSRVTHFEASTLAESWTGTTWTVQSTPVLVGSLTSGLAGVSCTSTSAAPCTTVGFVGTDIGTERALAESEGRARR